jgi:hypothetical protein
VTAEEGVGLVIYRSPKQNTVRNTHDRTYSCCICITERVDCGIAQVIGKELISERYAVDVSEMKSVTSLAGYNAIVIGAPVYTGKVTGDVVVFVTANKDELSHLPVAGFVTQRYGDPI